MINDLKLIKDKYGEKMMHLCRSLFPTLLETPGLLFKLLSDNFDYNKFLYDDIVEESKEQEFKNYIYSLIDVEKKEFIVDKTPEELLSEAGYILYECKTEKDIQKFKKYYAKNEELCTFEDERLKRCHVFFAVKKNVDEIKRENFSNPKREDEYGTSVISIQFSRGAKNTVSIKNRYNHRVNNPDATFNNNLDNIIEGLTKSFEINYNLNTYKKSDEDFELKNYVMANDGKYYKYIEEINNIYYCINNIIIDNYKVINTYQEKEKYIILDYFILDLENKTIKLYDEDMFDSFVLCIQDINKIEVKVEKETKNKIIYLYSNNNKVQTIKINEKNQIIYYKNDYIYKIEDDFLFFNETLKEIILTNVIEIKDNFLRNNEELKYLFFPRVMKIGDNFCLYNEKIESANFPKLELVGKNFLNSTAILSKINFPKLIKVGSHFLYSNFTLKELNLPSLMYVGNSFLFHNIYITKINLPNLITIHSDFMNYNRRVEKINLPNLESVGAHFLFSDENKIELNAPKLKKVGSFFLTKASVENLDLPNLEEVGDNFLSDNRTLKVMNIPKLKLVGDNFLFYSHKYNDNLKHKINNLINKSTRNYIKILMLGKKKNGR